jgi:phosphatidylglycerophosphate synthase
MLTLFSSLLGTAAGVIFALGWGFLAGWIAACAQVFDGVDGQFARLTGQQSKEGAFWDSVLDRYADGAMVIGTALYLILLPIALPLWLLLVLGGLALIGCNLVSYSSARAESLGMNLGRPALVSKGTRTAVMILCAWGSPLWPDMPILALLYLAVHPNITVITRLKRALHTVERL